MTTHFLFKEGVWEGSGNITLPLSDEPLSLTIQWTITPVDEGRFRAVQQVIVEGHDPMVNTFTVGSHAEGEFQIFLENEAIGMFSGTGVSDEKQLAWEFAHKGALEGYEVYQRQGEKEYSFHAEYLGGEGFATVVSGSIKEGV